MSGVSVEKLQARLQELEAAIAETERRLPAHSVKPPVMHDLLALEDERDEVLQQLNRLLNESGRKSAEGV